jgi:hypothetical protein
METGRHDTNIVSKQRLATRLVGTSKTSDDSVNIRLG